MERAFLAIVFSAMLVSSAYAGQYALLMNGHAMHLRKAPGFENEDNYGLGLQYDFEPSGRSLPFAFAAGFQDSHHDPSYALGGGYRWRMVEAGSMFDIDVGVTGMAMTRRSFQDGKPFPALLPMVAVGMGPIAMNVLYIPDVDPRLVPVLFFQLRYSLE